MKKVWLLATVLLFTLTITTISCFGGGSSSSGDDDDDDGHNTEECLAMIQDMSMCLAEVGEGFPCGLSDANDLLDACKGQSSNPKFNCLSSCGFDEFICQDMVSCMKDCCGEGNDDDDDDDTFPDDDDDDDDCDGNTAPTFDMVIWVVGESQVEYPVGGATATIADIVGVGFSYEDAECNLIGGYGTASITVDGETQTDELGPYTDDIDCSTAQSQRIIGFFYDGPLPAGTYDWTFTATDICGATSAEESGTFTITE